MTRDGRLERYAAGEMSEAERDALEREALDDPALFEALYGDATLRARLDDAAAEATRVEAPRADIARTEAARAETRRRRGRAWWRSHRFGFAATLAAAAMLVLVVRVTDGPEPPSPPMFRGDHDPPTGIEPRGEVDADPGPFRWTHAAGASQYRFELLTGETVLVYEVVVGDSTLTLPASALPEAPAGRYFWRVTPLDADGNPGRPSDPTWFSWSGADDG